LLLLYTLTSTTELYTLSLHDALPIFASDLPGRSREDERQVVERIAVEDDRYRDRRAHGSERKETEERVETDSDDRVDGRDEQQRSEEHTSELQSRFDLVCRLLLEKKK